jgi:hypothetical protein
MSEENGALTAEQILSAEDLQFERVEVPEWGGYVNVWTLSMSELESYQQGIATAQEKLQRRPANMMAALAAKAIRTAEGERVFTDKQIGDLGKKSASALMRVFNVAIRLNHMSKNDVEELAGNSEGAPSET